MALGAVQTAAAGSEKQDEDLRSVAPSYDKLKAANRGFEPDVPPQDRKSIGVNIGCPSIVRETVSPRPLESNRHHRGVERQTLDPVSGHRSRASVATRDGVRQQARASRTLRRTSGLRAAGSDAARSGARRHLGARGSRRRCRTLSSRLPSCRTPGVRSAKPWPPSRWRSRRLPVAPP